MPREMAEVSADDLVDLMHAVERLRRLGSASRAAADGGDPMTLFDALSEVYAASQRLVGPHLSALPASLDA
jgi:hypothetical protein